MNRDELIEKIKKANIHVWSKQMAGVEEVFVEGRIEYFERFVQQIINECNLAVHNDYNQHYRYYKEYKHTPDDVEQAINKHFGIEDGDKK